jgi:hypothetical protein
MVAKPERQRDDAFGAAGRKMQPRDSAGKIGEHLPHFRAYIAQPFDAIEKQPAFGNRAVRLDGKPQTAGP